MNTENIVNTHLEKEVFEAILEEACRQWCDLIEDAPERKDGVGFAQFFYEIFNEKREDFIENNIDLHKCE